MPIYGFRRRVACYVTRATGTGSELLVFDHADDDPEQPSGTQIPAGGMLPFEGIEDAAAREVAEEVGLTGLTFVAQLGGVEVALGDPGGPSVTTFVHLSAPVGGPASWEHQVTGDGEDEGMTFVCRWASLPLDVELAGDQGAYLDAISTAE
ncbi:MAG TPA: NUDIX domain-containing protein [Nocardioidaceae bacterium]|nr:NUDIX domain-containing protein [Nocardioidaceae bacterium]